MLELFKLCTKPCVTRPDTCLHCLSAPRLCMLRAGYNGYNGRPRITLTLVVAVSFQEAVVINNRAGRGGVSSEARQV